MDNLNTARAQGIARAFADKGPICFVAVYHEHEANDATTRAALGVAVANERGYYPLPQFYFHAGNDLDAAEAKADSLNSDVLNLDAESVMGIRISTMGGQRYHAPTEEGAAQ